MAAALAAARAGAQVWLVERRAAVGGTVTAALIHTLAGLFDSRGELLQEGLATELVARLTSRGNSVRRRRMGRLWVLNVSPSLYRDVVSQWIVEEPRILLCRRSRVTRITSESNEVVRLEITGPDGTFAVRPTALIDATGTAAVVRQIAPDLVQPDGNRCAAGLIFQMRGIVPRSLEFPRGAAVVQALRAAAARGELPPTCGKAWIDAGTEPDEAFIKLFVPTVNDGRQRYHESLRAAHRDRDAIVTFLRQLPAFADARLVQPGRLGIRDGGRVCGEYCLTGDDVRQLRKFTDAACRGCWPIEYWDRQRGVSLEYLPDGGYYDIPLGALRVKGLRNVWAAGKCLSADPYAHASARVVGTCWAMGEAVGKAAVLSSSLSAGRSDA
jgi:hypothetical protein